MPWNMMSWDHDFWSVVRFIVSIRKQEEQNQIINNIHKTKQFSLIDGSQVPISDDIANSVKDYFTHRELVFKNYMNLLRTEESAKEYCNSNKLEIKTTATRNDNHQSSKSLIAAVDGVASRVLSKKKLKYNQNPQNRCVWFQEKALHVTARNLDGAIPSLFNPSIIWEIKEYWGKTSGGSKMSDAVYECHLVGKELREYEQKANIKIKHLVFLDGKEQWSARKSDLKRFIDLELQGLIDKLFIGKAVENEWEQYLESNI